MSTAALPDVTQVYRMHSLLPEKVEVVDSQTEATLAVVGLDDVIFGKGTQVSTRLKAQELLYSYGIGHAGMAVVVLLMCWQQLGPQGDSVIR